MVRYYCNKCEALLSATKYTVVVKLPDGTQQPAVHLCSDCYKKLNRFYKDMNREMTEEVQQIQAGEAAKQEIAKQLGIESTEGREAMPPLPDENNGESSPENDSYTGQKKVYTVNSAVIGKMQIKEELPGRPLSEKDVPKIRRILIDFYREVSPKTTQARLGMDNLTWKRWVTKYASTTVLARWNEYKRFAEPGKEKAVDTDKVLTLAGGGFPVREIAKEVDCDDQLLIDEILQWYTGV